MMDFLSGFSECWWPSPACRVDWTAAAALATASAAVIALFVGVAPVAHRILNGRARARTLAKVFLAELDLSVFWIAVGYQVAELHPGDDDHYNASIGFALNCRRVDIATLLDEIEHCPRRIADAVAHFGAKSTEFQRTVCGNDGVPLVAPDDLYPTPTGTKEIGPLLHAGIALHRDLHVWLFHEVKTDIYALAKPTATRIHRSLKDGTAQAAE